MFIPFSKKIFSTRIYRRLFITKDFFIKNTIMKEVIIHIGDYKTGSTAIQLALNSYQDDSTRYASFSDQNHSQPMTTIFAKNPNKYGYWKDWNFTEKEIEVEKKIYKTQLQGDLNNTSFQRLIISGEDISILQDDEKNEMLNFFKLHNWNCKILCFVRDPIQWVAAAANTSIRLGRNPKNLTFNPKQKILQFIDNLGIQNINVFDYSNLVINNINLIDFVSKFLNIKLKTNKIVNESMSLEATAIIYKLNNTPIDFLGYSDRMLVRREIVNRTISFFALNKGFKKPDPLIFIGLLQKKSVEENCKWLKNLFGIEYSFNANDYNEKNISKYFEDALSRIPELLKEYFSHFQISFDASISLEKNLINLFLDQIQKFKAFNLSNEERLLFNKKLSPYSSSPELPADFNVLDYLLLNPDVLRSNIDPVEHYLIYGKEENRQYNKEFKRSQTTNLNFDRSSPLDRRFRRIVKKYILKFKLIFQRL
jgi:hypothetical protein